MRVNVTIVLASVLWSASAAAQMDLCSNIRLSVAEQIECRGRFTNSLGEGDRLRIQQEYEDRIRRANDQLITPPILNSSPPTATSAVPSTTPPVLPAVPPRPGTPALPGAPAPGSVLPATPRSTPPAGGNALLPDLTAPDPTDTPLPPISPLPVNPAVTPPPAK